jgi:hypothetical protein
MTERRRPESMKVPVRKREMSCDPEEMSPQRRGNDEKEDRIGRRLREAYDEILNEPVPDRFLDLLRKLDKPGSGSP